MNKDTKKFTIKVICKNCGSDNCTIDGYGGYYDSGVYIECNDCNKFEEVSNHSN